MKNLTQKEVKEINGGTSIDPNFMAAAIAEALAQYQAIQNIGNITGTSDDYHTP